MEKSDRKRSPQENKRLSYERDCINQYGENNKSSRKSIRRFKAASNRAGRRGVNKALQSLEHAPDEAAHETSLLEAEHLAIKPRQTKVPDAPLKEVVPYRTRVTARWASALKPVFKELGEAGITSPRTILVELHRRRIVAPHGTKWTPWLIYLGLKSLGIKNPWGWSGKFD